MSRFRFNSTFFLYIVSIVTNVALFVFIHGQLTTNQQLNTHLSENAQQAVIKATELTNIERHIGYVGFIHHFKNYVIRGDADYYNQALTSYQSAMRSIKTLKKLDDSTVATSNLSILERTLHTYREQLDHAKQQGPLLAVEALDQLVKVDDSQAATALEALSNEFIEGFLTQNTITNETARIQRERTIFVSIFLIPFFIFSTIFSLGVTQRLSNALKTNNKILKNLRSTQKELIEAEKMAALGGLVAGVAHEINTPLGIAITGITHQQEMLENINQKVRLEEVTVGDFDKYTANAEKTHELILNHLNRAATLVNNFKQVAVDQANPEFKETSFDSFIANLVMTFHPQIKHTKLKFFTLVAPDCEAYTCPGALAQVLTILTQNCIFHAFSQNEKGTITIRVGYATNGVIIEISDDGVGVHPDHVKKLFEPFFTTKRSEGGSGLGLSIAHNIVTDILKGKLAFEHNYPKGSKFIITLPNTVKSQAA